MARPATTSAITGKFDEQSGEEKIYVRLGMIDYRVHDVKHGARIHVLPFGDTIEGARNLFDVYLKPYWRRQTGEEKGYVFGDEG